MTTAKIPMSWHAGDLRMWSKEPRLPRTLDGHATSHVQAEAELARMLRRMNRAAGPLVPLERPQSRSPHDERPGRVERLQPARSAFSSLERPNARQDNRNMPAPATAPLRQVEVRLVDVAEKTFERLFTRAGAAIGLALVALVCAAGLFGDVIRSKEDTQTLGRRFAALDAGTARDLKAQNRRIDDLRSEFQHVKRPPSAFSNAEDFMKLNRWADAEAAYGRYLAEFPSGPLAGAALRNSAIAAAMMGNCSLAASRLTALQQRFPLVAISAQRMDGMLSECRRTALARGR